MKLSMITVRLCSRATMKASRTETLSISRIVSAVQAALAGDVGGMGGVVDTPPEDPDLAAGEAGVDTDGDGMPDDWEVDEGLDAADPGDAHMIRAGSAYTALEDYLNELAGPPP